MGLGSRADPLCTVGNSKALGFILGYLLGPRNDLGSECATRFASCLKQLWNKLESKETQGFKRRGLFSTSREIHRLGILVLDDTWNDSLQPQSSLQTSKALSHFALKCLFNPIKLTHSKGKTFTSQHQDLDCWGMRPSNAKSSTHFTRWPSGSKPNGNRFWGCLSTYSKLHFLRGLLGYRSFTFDPARGNRHLPESDYSPALKAPAMKKTKTHRSYSS